MNRVRWTVEGLVGTDWVNLGSAWWDRQVAQKFAIHFTDLFGTTTRVVHSYRGQYFFHRNHLEDADGTDRLDYTTDRHGKMKRFIVTTLLPILWKYQTWRTQ